MSTLKKCMRFRRWNDECGFCKKKEQPFWKKKCLSVNETAAYTGIGRGKIRELMKRKDCNFMTTDGYQVYVIIDKFVEFLNSRNEI